MDYFLSEETKDKVVRYAISSGMTFATGMIMILIDQWDNITLETIRDGSVLGVLFLAVRGGVKAVFELFIMWRAKHLK